MRFLADESCDFAVVRTLRLEGHDVLAVGEFRQRSVDSEVMALARTENRILLTEDKDFGWLAFVAQMESPGVVLIRFPATSRPLLASAVRQLVGDHLSRLTGSFVVLRPGSARFSRGPRR
jgi:predicted nuclease of predicted toxin-antitoxin system